jgi:hypothetical protein
MARSVSQPENMIEAIRVKVARGQWEFSLHATRQVIARKISTGEVGEAIAVGEVIEDYPQDKYGPSVLLLGRTAAGRVLHVQCTYPSRPVVKIITIYEPDPAQWDEALKHRR